MTTPIPPKKLTTSARKWWHDVHHAHGFRDPAELRLLDLAAQALADHERFRTEAARTGATVDTKNGPKVAPAVTAANAALQQHLKLLVALGIARTGNSKTAAPGSRYAPRHDDDFEEAAPTRRGARDLSGIFPGRKHQ